MKIGVVGICTAPGIGMAMRQLMEGNEVWAILAVAARRDNKLQEAADLLHNCEIVFTHYLPGEYGPLSTTALRNRCSNVHMMPAMSFTGYHPDSVYIDHAGKHLSSPTGPYHSAIAAAAYSLGLGAAKAGDLFNADIFEHLGYFDEFGKATRFLRKRLEEAGLDISEDWQALLDRAPFMHTINHPKAILVGTISKLLATKAELVPKSTATPELVHDTLSAHPVWPVYPSLGDRIGVRGSYLFKREGGPDLVGGRGVFFGLREFLERSFSLYATYPREAFSVPAVAGVRKVLQTLNLGCSTADK